MVDDDADDIDKEYLIKVYNKSKDLSRKENLLILEINELKNKLNLEVSEYECEYLREKLEKIKIEQQIHSGLIKTNENKINELKSDIESISSDIFKKNMKLID